jgi:hypothetical protein
MKRVLQHAMVSILGVALMAAGAPLEAASYSAHEAGSNGGARVQNVAWHGGQDTGREQHDQYRGRADGYARQDYRHRDYDRGAWAGDYGRSYYANGYAYPADGYYYGESHDGRAAAIIGGSAAAGAVIGGAAGHSGESAVIGAVVGGIAGAIANQAVQHHDWR